MTKGYKHMSPCEIALAKTWHKDDEAIAQITKLLKRDRKTVKTHIFGKTVNTAPKGRPLAITVFVDLVALGSIPGGQNGPQ